MDDKNGILSFNRDDFLVAQKSIKIFSRSVNKALDEIVEKLDALNDRKLLRMNAESETVRQDFKAVPSKAKSLDGLSDIIVGGVASGIHAAAERIKKENEELKIAIENSYQPIQKSASHLEKPEKSVKGTVQLPDTVAGLGSQLGQGKKGGLKGTLISLLTSQVGVKLGQNVLGFAETQIESAFGSRVGNAAGKILNNAFEGALAGIPFGSLGVAVGGIIGGMSGAIEAATDYVEAKNDAFRKVVEDSYNSLKTAEDDFLSRSTIGAMQNMISGAATGKSAEYYKAFQQVEESKAYLQDEAGNAYYEVQAESKQNEADYYNLQSETGQMESEVARARGIKAGELENKERDLEVAAKTWLATGEESALIQNPENREQLEAYAKEYNSLDKNSDEGKLRMIELYNLAENIGWNEFIGSKEHQLQKASDRSLRAGIRQNTAADELFFNSELLDQEEASKGINSVAIDKMQQAFNIWFESWSDYWSEDLNKTLTKSEGQHFPKQNDKDEGDRDEAYSHIVGGSNKKSSTPTGEMILPQQPFAVTINFGDMAIRQEADIQKISDVIISNIKKAFYVTVT